MNAGIGAVGFPAVQISLRFFQTLEAFSLEGLFLAWPTPRSTFPLPKAVDYT